MAGLATIGKSLSFLLPAYCSPDSVTVVISPFLALQSDLLNHCKKMAIHSEIWDTNQAYTAPLILVTPKAFTTTAFLGFINRLIVRQRLDRVVLDECHLVLSNSYEFRPQLRTIGSFLQSIAV